MSRQTVYEEGHIRKERRRKPAFWDRIKVLLILGIFFGVLVIYNLNPPFVTLGDAYDIAAADLVGRILLVLMALEVLRQAHYLVSEHWAAYNHFWAHRVIGGTERQTKKRMSDWTRFRIARLFKVFLFLLAVGYAVMILNEDVTNPIDGLLAIPRLIGQYAYFIIYFIFIMTMVVGQFVAIFWFLSRGGIDIVFPEDIETRFDSVWGQDHVLDLVKENVAFLEKPDEIEAKGGYIPGGILLWGPPGTGKGEPVSSLLMTPTGPRRMGDLLPGDFVIGSDGMPTRIDQVHLLGERDLYRVRFSDDTSIRVTEDHLWAVTSRYGGRKVIETKQLIGRLTEADGHQHYRIPMVETVEFAHRPVPLDPYLLGVLLGDGSFRHQLRISSRDDEIIDAVRSLLPDGDSLNRHRGYDHDIVGGGTRAISKELGLFGKMSHEKFVPEDYLWTSSQARLALLQGLMDTDGTVDQRGGIVFSTTSRALADAVVLLVQSFGGTCSTRERVPTYTYRDERREERLAYEVRIAVDNEIPVFRLARKAERVVPRTRYSPTRFITDITPDGREEARCIKVTADNHLYVTENFTVTHNTLMAEAIAGEVGKPFVFVDPGAFIQMFMGVGILKVKRLFRKLRKLSLQHGGVIVFFDEADSLGSRGAMPAGGPFQPYDAADDLQCNGLGYVSGKSRYQVLDSMGLVPDGAAPADRPARLIDRVIMGMGMGGGGGMGTLQALLTEMSGLKKPRGLSNRVRRTLGMKPKPPPKYRILIIMATNMPNALDEAMLRPGRIDRIYKVGYPSKDGRLETFRGYLEQVKHDLTEAQVDQLATMTPYYSGAKIKDLVNEGLILAIREDRDTIAWQDIWKARSLKELGPPEDVEYIERERHAVAIHEASHAVAAHLLRSHRMIDLVSIEKRQTTLGMVASLDIEDRVTQWRTELEIDIKVSLASLAGERMFFGGDNSSGVSNDLRAATHLTSLMEGVYGMGGGILSLVGLPQNPIGTTPDPTGKVVQQMADRIEERLQELYEQTYELLEQHRDDLVRLAAVLEERKTISGDDVAEVMGTPPGSWTAHFPQGFAAVQPEPLPAADDEPSGNGSGNGQVKDRPEEPVAGE